MRKREAVNEDAFFIDENEEIALLSSCLRVDNRIKRVHFENYIRKLNSGMIHFEICPRFNRKMLEGNYKQ